MSDKEYKRMPTEKGRLLLEMYYHQKIGREMMECSLHQIDPMKIDLYADYIRNMQRKHRENAKKAKRG